MVGNLFGDIDPIGQVMRINKIPFSTHISGRVRAIMVQAQSLELMFEAEKQINALLMQRHRIRPGQEKDFTVRNEDVISAFNCAD